MYSYGKVRINEDPDNSYSFWAKKKKVKFQVQMVSIRQVYMFSLCPMSNKRKMWFHSLEGDPYRHLFTFLSKHFLSMSLETTVLLTDRLTTYKWYPYTIVCPLSGNPKRLPLPSLIKCIFKHKAKNNGLIKQWIECTLSWIGVGFQILF